MTTTRAERVTAAREDGPLSVGDVAVLFGVDPKTVTRWARAGKLPSFRTLGGHTRFQRADVAALLEGTVQ